MDRLPIAVVGAHMDGMPLNRDLVALGATFMRRTTTTRDYRFYALAGGPPRRPGLLRVADGEGAAIEVEVWSLDAAGFGQFVADIPPPLGVGTLRLADGSTPKGFLVEPQGIVGAEDITSYGGWRRYMAALAVVAT
jgi:allophanate hydrolase